MFGDVRAARPITQIFGQLLFAAVWTRNSRLDRHLRHVSHPNAPYAYILADDNRWCKGLPPEIVTKVTLSRPGTV